MYPDGYTRVSIEKFSDGDPSDDESCTSPHEGLISGSSKPTSKSGSRRLLRRGLWATAAVALVGSYVGMFFVGRYSLSEMEKDESCIRRTSSYSPVLKFMNPEPKMTQFNGSLGYPSEYTGDPSPEVDAAWHEWSHIRYASIPAEEIAKLPGAEEEDYKDASRLTPEYGGGYIGFVEFNHQMHCLNLLRQGLHPDYYNNPEKPEQMPLAFTDKPHMIKLHLQHCIEALRQNIACNADVGVITSRWLTDFRLPYANFNTFHQCRDIDSVKRWIEENEIPDTPDGSDLPMPLDAKIFSTPP